MGNTIRTLAAEEMYYGLTFPRARKYKTIHDELTTKHLLSERVSSWYNVIDYEILVSDFELQSHYYIPFRKNTLGKGMNP